MCPHSCILEPDLILYLLSSAQGNNGRADHLDKQGPYRRQFSITEDINVLKVYTYTWNGRYFFLNIERDNDLGWAFHVEMLGSESECSEYGLELTVHRTGKNVYRFKGEPCSVDEGKEDKRCSGLIISNNIMNKKILLQNGENFEFHVSIEFMFSRDIALAV